MWFKTFNAKNLPLDPLYAGHLQNDRRRPIVQPTRFRIRQTDSVVLIIAPNLRAISTTTPIREGYHSITPYLIVQEAGYEPLLERG